MIGSTDRSGHQHAWCRVDRDDLGPCPRSLKADSIV